MKNQGIPFDGFKSVVEMLERSDVQFREKILMNLRKRDPSLAKRLEAHLRASFAAIEDEDSRAALERGRRAAHARSYGQ